MAGFFMHTTVMCGRNMVSVCFLFLFVNFQLINGKPFFGMTMFCDLFCEDDDTPDDAARKSSPSSLDELFGSVWDPCSECPSSGSTDGAANVATTPKVPAVAPAMQPPLNFMIPPSTGMNLTMIPFGSSWQMNFSPWSGPTGASGSGAPGGTATTAPAATTAAAAAAPAATTAAPAGATTAAAGATTAAPTTAKA